MRNSIKILVMLAVASIAGISNAQVSTSVDATINATVIAPITITKNHDMALGKIVSDPVGGTMSIAADGTRTFNNNANKLPTPWTGTPAEFTVSGDAGCTFSTHHNGLGGGSSENHLFLSDGSGNFMAFDLDATGSQSLASGAVDYKVTGTLTIGGSSIGTSAQPAGTYSGSFTELVAYE